MLDNVIKFVLFCLFFFSDSNGIIKINQLVDLSSSLSWITQLWSVLVNYDIIREPSLSSLLVLLHINVVQSRAS